MDNHDDTHTIIRKKTCVNCGHEGSSNSPESCAFGDIVDTDTKNEFRNCICGNQKVDPHNISSSARVVIINGVKKDAYPCTNPGCAYEATTDHYHDVVENLEIIGTNDVCTIMHRSCASCGEVLADIPNANHQDTVTESGGGLFPGILKCDVCGRVTQGPEPTLPTYEDIKEETTPSIVGQVKRLVKRFFC